MPFSAGSTAWRRAPPAAAISTLRMARVNNAAPSSVSSALIWRLMADCVRNNPSAAALNDRRRATALKARRPSSESGRRGGVFMSGEGLWLGTGQQVLAEPWRADEAAALQCAQTAAAPAQGLARGRGGDWRAAARGWGAAAGRLAAAARSAEAMANRAQGSIRPGDSIASQCALQ